MTECRQGNESILGLQHFGSDPADFRIRIRINTELQSGIPDLFWLRLDALAEVCALWVQSNSNMSQLFYDATVSRGPRSKQNCGKCV